MSAPGATTVSLSTPGPVARTHPGLSLPLRQPGSERASGKGAGRSRKDLCVSGKAPLRLARGSPWRPSARAPAPTGRGREPTSGSSGGPPRLGPGSWRRPAPPPGPAAPAALPGPGKPAARALCGSAGRGRPLVPSAERCRPAVPGTQPFPGVLGGLQAPAAGKTALSGGREKSIPGALLKKNESPRRRAEGPPCECLALRCCPPASLRGRWSH